MKEQKIIYMVEEKKVQVGNKLIIVKNSKKLLKKWKKIEERLTKMLPIVQI